MINDTFLKWCPILTVVSQVGILGLFIFLICINDLPEICNNNGNESKMYLYTYDAKLYKKIKNESYCSIFTCLCYAWHWICHRKMSVRLSVCLSHASIMSKQLNISSNFFQTYYCTLYMNMYFISRILLLIATRSNSSSCNCVHYRLFIDALCFTSWCVMDIAR